MRYLVYLLLLLGATAPASWSQYLVSDRRLLGMTIENPRAPGFGMEQVAPQVHKWYVPPHLAQSRAQPWYRIDSRYGADVYRRYVDHTLEGTEWYDTFGDPLGRGWLVYTWEQTQVQRNGSVLSKGPADPTRTNPYRQWFQNLVVASDQQEGRTYSLMVGDRIHTRFTPLTLYKPNFDGLRLDYASDRYVTTLLLSRPSSPAGGRRNNATHFMAGHLQAPLGDLGTVGLSYVNAHNVTTQTDFSYGNALRGSLTTAQNQPLEKIWVQLRDDSPEDGVAGATLFRHEIVLVDSTGRTLRGREIGLRPRVEGGRIRDGALVADGLDVVLLEYDLTTLDPTIVEAAAVEQVAVELAVANDYRIEMASNLQNNGDRLNPETVFFTRSRAAGNVQDESNGRLVIVEYGLPTANELLGIDWNLVEWKGLSLMGEGVLNRRYSKYPGPDEAHHHLVVEQAVAAYVNLGYNRGPWTLFGEAFSIADGYSTNYWLAQSNGEVRFKAPVPDLYEFVDDDDDYDAIPEWERPFQLSSRQVAWPGYDENRDFLNDHNQNANLLPDYEEPFLRYYSDRPEFLFGLDMNHNGTADRFENDQLPDYPYKRDHRGVNVYGRVQAGPETSLLIGRQQMGLVAGDGRTRSVYSMATWEANGPRLGKVRVFHFAALVQDDIPDDLLLWAQPVGGLGRMREVPDRRPGRDSWRSTLYADMDQRFGEGLRTMHRFKWETWRQRDDRQLVKEREGRMRSGFVGVVNKVEWTVPMGLGVLQPRFKSEYRTDRPFTTRLSTSSSIQETAILLWVQPLMAESVNVSYYPRYGRNLFNTQLQLGLEWTGFWMLDGTREDIDQDFRGRTILAQLTNRVAYSGYQLITRAGVQWIRRRFEDGARQQSSVLFMTVHAGLK